MVTEDSRSRKTFAEFRSRVRFFFDQTIWRPTSPEASGGERVLRRVGRFVYLLVRGFRDDRVLARAPALTLASLLALIPLLALSLLGATMFGYRHTALAWLRQFLADYLAAGQQEVVQVVISYLEDTNLAAMGSVGLFFLLYAAVYMLGTIEGTFNDIWGVSQGRPIHRKVTDYLAVLVVFPVLIFVSTAITATVSSLAFVERAREVTILSGVVGVTLKVLPLLSIVLGFTFLYKYMPYTSVRFRSAVLAGFFAGLAWHIAQWAFIRFQIGVTTNNIIYGTFSALPIFLLWLNTSWIIVLVGCEIAYAAQHEASYHPPIPAGLVSIAQRERAALQVLARIWERFSDGMPPESAGDIAAEVDLPRPVTMEILEALVHCGTLARSSMPEDALLPARDLSQSSLGDLLLAFRHAGKTSHGDLGGFLDGRVRALHDRLEGALRNEGSQPLATFTGHHRA